jgi:hypothetical protein
MTPVQRKTRMQVDAKMPGAAGPLGWDWVDCLMGGLGVVSLAQTLGPGRCSPMDKGLVQPHTLGGANADHISRPHANAGLGKDMVWLDPSELDTASQHSSCR